MGGGDRVTTGTFLEGEVGIFLGGVVAGFGTSVVVVVVVVVGRCAEESPLPTPGRNPPRGDGGPADGLGCVEV